MSSFTDGCRAQTQATVRLAGAWPERYGTWKNALSVGGRAQRGCLGLMIFGIAYLLVPLTIFICAEMVLLSYAGLMGLLWGIGATVDALHH